MFTPPDIFYTYCLLGKCTATPHHIDNPAIRLKVHHRASIIKASHLAQGIFHPGIRLRLIEGVPPHIVVSVS